MILINPYKYIWIALGRVKEISHIKKGFVFLNCTMLHLNQKKNGNTNNNPICTYHGVGACVSWRVTSLTRPQVNPT